MYVTQEVRSCGGTSFVHNNEEITKFVCNTPRQLIFIDFIDSLLHPYFVVITGYTNNHLKLTVNRTNDLLEDYSASNMDVAAKELQIHNVDAPLQFHTGGVLAADILAWQQEKQVLKLA